GAARVFSQGPRENQEGPKKSAGARPAAGGEWNGPRPALRRKSRRYRHQAKQQQGRDRPRNTSRSHVETSYVRPLCERHTKLNAFLSRSGLDSAERTQFWGLCRERKKQSAQAVAALERGREQVGKNSTVAAVHAFILGKVGRRTEAAAALKELANLPADSSHYEPLIAKSRAFASGGIRLQCETC